MIDRLSVEGDASRAPLVFTLPRMNTNHLDFSFSGLKTAVMRYVRENSIPAVTEEPSQQIIDLAASFQEKVVRSLTTRLEQAARRHNPGTIILAGGVACNRELRARVSETDFGAPVYYPSPALTTDNAAMIAAAGNRRLFRGESDGLEFSAAPSMKLQNFVVDGYEVLQGVRYRI